MDYMSKWHDAVILRLHGFAGGLRLSEIRGFDLYYPRDHRHVLLHNKLFRFDICPFPGGTSFMSHDGKNGGNQCL